MIIITGIPASGKTTLARRLAKDAGLRLIEQDAVKEAMADWLGGEITPAQSSILGRATRRAVLEVGAGWLGFGEAIIVESALQAEAAEVILRELAPRATLQLYIECDLREAEHRLRARRAAGERHWVHADDIFEKMTDEEIRQLYRPLAMSNMRTVHIDARNGEAAYQVARQAVMDYVKESSYTKEVS